MLQLSNAALSSHPTLGRYELLDLLGRGGMAEVYKARLLGIHGVEKWVALKRILPHALVDPKFVKLFVREAQISTRLMHPNLIQIFEFGQEGGELFLAMEWVEGCDLRHVLRAQAQLGKRLSPELAVCIAHGMLQGLEHAHRLTDENGLALNVVHRDLSPANVLLSYAGAIKVADFGVAHMDGPERSDANLLKGKLPYMAPEQLSGDAAVDARVDVFAAACVLYEMLAGDRVYPGEVTPQLIRRVTTGEVPEVRRALPHLDPALAEVVQRALAPDRARRTPSAECFDTELMEWVHAHGERPIRESDLGLYLQILVPRAPKSGEPDTGVQTPLGSQPPPPPLLDSSVDSDLDVLFDPGSVVLLGRELLLAAPLPPPSPLPGPAAPLPRPTTPPPRPLAQSPRPPPAPAEPAIARLPGRPPMLLALMATASLTLARGPETVPAPRQTPVGVSAPAPQLETRGPFLPAPPSTLHLDSAPLRLEVSAAIPTHAPPPAAHSSRSRSRTRGSRIDRSGNSQ